MDILNASYAMEKDTGPAVGRINRPSITDRLKERKAYHIEQLEQINSALAVLESNPAVQVVIDQLAKLNF